MTKFFIITFGCKLNQAESDMISADLISLGLRAVTQPPADLVIINACAVTAKAEREVAKKISALKKDYPNTKIILTGCFSSAQLASVDLALTNRDKDKLKNIVAQCFPLSNQPVAACYASSDRPHPHRAFIKIQTGCHNFCSYCIVPLLRGLPTSRPTSPIIKDIIKVEKQGLKEAVLTGVNIGLYGQETKQSKKHPPATQAEAREALRAGEIESGLPSLLHLILARTNIPRIRLGSLWPTHITTELIRLYSREPRLLPHFHLSIQSGSNRILKLMNRHYTRQEILKITSACRAQIKNINFTGDIIVGFPGETERDFQDTCDLIKTIGFSKVHIFQFSSRPGTRAAKMSDQISESIKKARYQKLTTLSARVASREKNKSKNKKLPVLWEGVANDWQYGFTSNYLRVRKKVKTGENWENRIEEFGL